MMYLVSCLLYHVSCIMSPVSCILYHALCLRPPASCLLSQVSCLISPVSCPLSPVSHLLFYVSCLLSHVSFILSQVINFRNLSQCPRNTKALTTENVRLLKTVKHSAMTQMITRLLHQWLGYKRHKNCY